MKYKENNKTKKNNKKNKNNKEKIKNMDKKNKKINDEKSVKFFFNKSYFKNNSLIQILKDFWNYIWYDDSILSYILNFFLAFIFIKFILFPGLGFLLNNDYPIVAIVSGSMEHKIVDHRICDKYILDTKRKSIDFDEWWNFCGYFYKDFNLTKSDLNSFDYDNGLNIGDVMVLYGKNPKDIKVGEILVFIPEDRHFFETKGPVIHRVIKKWKDDNGEFHFQTKGDHNSKSFENFETDIPQKNVIGVAVLRIPFIGYVKLIGYHLIEFIKSQKLI